jgi:hypothetical protein
VGGCLCEGGIVGSVVRRHPVELINIPFTLPYLTVTVPYLTLIIICLRPMGGAEALRGLVGSKC